MRIVLADDAVLLREALAAALAASGFEVVGQDDPDLLFGRAQREVGLVVGPSGGGR